MSVFFEDTYHINSRDADPLGLCRPSSLMGYLQEAATGAAESGGFTRERLIREYHVFWMLARIWYSLKKPVPWNSNLTVRTWHRGNPGMMMYRDFDLILDGDVVGEAVSVWVMADVVTRKLSKMSTIPNLMNTSGGELCKSKNLQKLRVPSSLPFVEERRLHYSDTDINGHVNNSRYADLACDALDPKHIGKSSFVSSLQLGYLGECRAGEMLRIHAGSGDDGLWYVHGLDEKGTARFDAGLTLSPLDNTGYIA